MTTRSIIAAFERQEALRDLQRLCREYIEDLDNNNDALATFTLDKIRAAVTQSEPDLTEALP